MRPMAVLVRAVGVAAWTADRSIPAPHRQAGFLLVMLMALGLVAGCGAVGGPPPTPVVVVVTAPPIVVTAAPPSPIVVVVTATPGPQAAATPTAAPAAASAQTTTATKPAGSPTAVAQAKPTAPATPPTPAPQTLQVGRTNSYRGLLFTVEEARSGEEIERKKAARGKVLVGLRMRVQNPSDAKVEFYSPHLNALLKLKLPSGGIPVKDYDDMFGLVTFAPREEKSGWVYFETDRSAPLDSLELTLGGSQETVVAIPFSGPEPKIAKRTFEYLRSTPEVLGLLWSVSGGELRLDLPEMQANPGQEFIVVQIRATNPNASELLMRRGGVYPLYGKDYLRIRADNGVLLQVSAELSPLPTEFPGKAEQDTLYAWQLPLGSKNPKLVILSQDGSEHELELGPLPPP